MIFRNNPLSKKGLFCFRFYCSELNTTDLTLSSWERAIMKKKSISILIENLVKKDNDEYIQMLYKEDEKGEDIVSDYEKDSVPEEMLLELLKNSSKDERIQSLLNEIIFYVNEDSITDKIFEYCLHYPTSWKETLLILLAHIELKQEQLERLIQVMEVSEAFYQLFLINLRDNNLHITQFRDFLLKNEKYFSSLVNFQEHVEGHSINQDKIELTNKLVREQIEICNQHTPDDSTFSSLFLLNLHDNDFSVSQFRDFLLENEQHLCSLENFQERIRGQNINQDKINLTNQIIREWLEKSIFFINLYDNNFSVSKFREFILENEKYPNILAHWWKHERKILFRRQNICQEKVVFLDQLMREKCNS